MHFEIYVFCFFLLVCYIFELINPNIVPKIIEEINIGITALTSSLATISIIGSANITAIKSPLTHGCIFQFTYGTMIPITTQWTKADRIANLSIFFNTIGKISIPPATIPVNKANTNVFIFFNF
jgi:hypothetical protein